MNRFDLVLIISIATLKLGQLNIQPGEAMRCLEPQGSADRTHLFEILLRPAGD